MERLQKGSPKSKEPYFKLSITLSERLHNRFIDEANARKFTLRVMLEEILEERYADKGRGGC